MHSTRRQVRAFTLVELLVVVSIVALLLAVLLPGLGRARAQAKTVKCLANLKSIGLAAHLYGQEHVEYPWVMRAPVEQRYTFTGLSEFVWGGAMPNKTVAEFQAAAPTSGNPPAPPNVYDVYNIPPRYRPMNRYIASEVTWDAEPNPSPGSPREVPAETPGFFRCPSDVTPFVPVVGRTNPPPEPDVAQPTWDYWGSSYPINWYWPYYYTGTPRGQAFPYFGLFANILGGRPQMPGLGRELLRDKQGRFASEFLLFYDNDLNYALEAARPPGWTAGPWASTPIRIVGWHGQFGRHSAAFLDGRAQHRGFDTRFVFGDGWMIWPNRPWEGQWAPLNDNAPGP